MSTITRQLYVASVALLTLCVVPACNSSNITAENTGGRPSAPDAWAPNTTGPDTGATSSDVGASSQGPPATIETRVDSSDVEAGTPLEVECMLLDADGNRVQVDRDLDFGLHYTPRNHFRSPSPLTLEPRETGEADVACKAPSLGLIDRSPVQLDVRPGPARTVRTRLDQNQVVAGTTVTAQCRIFDEFGNRLETASPEVQVDAMGAGISIQQRDVTIETSGIYMVTCRMDGAEREMGASLEVSPGRPAQLTLTPKPSRSVYGLNQVVRFETMVADRYGNRVSQAEVDFESQPSSGADAFGYARYRFDREGTYTVTATVSGETYKDRDLSKSAQITINGEGPDIRCTSPSAGAVLDRDPSGQITFRGEVDDPNGVKKLSINGSQAQVNGKTFSKQVDTEFGINFVDLEAEDSYNKKSSRTCAFLIADKWSGAQAHLGDSVSMRLDQKAMDDGDRNDGLDSFADIISRALTSEGLKERIGREILDRNPLRDKCERDTFAGCIASTKVKYLGKSWDPDRGLQLKSLDSIDLNWTRDGMEVSASIGGIGVRMLAEATGAGLVTVDTKGWVRADRISLSFDTDISLQNNRLQASINKQSVQVDVQGVDLDFGGGLSSLLFSAIESLFQGQIQGLVEDQFESYIENNLDPILDDLFSSLDINSLGRTVNVPQLAGNGQTEMNFGVRFSSFDTDPRDRASVGIGTQFRAKNVQRTGTSQGVPIPKDKVKLDPNTNRAVGVGVHLGVVNQVLHTLWRAGMFDVDLGRSLLGSSVPQGTEATLSLDLPPVAKRQGSNNQVDLMLGGATLELVYPGIFSNPVDIRVGLVARTKVDIQGQSTLEFDDIQLVDFYFTPRDVSLAPQTRSTIESFLKELFQNVVDRSLNSSLPSLPIPSFTLPNSLNKYNLPAGQDLGLEQPAINPVRHHFLLEGDFGVK